jgi:hypothetical protein
MRLADVPKALEIFGLDFVSFVSGLGSDELDALVPLPFRLFPLPLDPEDPADDVDILFFFKPFLLSLVSSKMLQQQ